MPENATIDELLVAAAVEPLPPATRDAAAATLREWLGPWVAAEDALAARKQAAEELARTAAGFERRRKWRHGLALAVGFLWLLVQVVREWIRPAGDLTGAIITQAAALPVAVALLLGTLALPAMKFAERQLVARDFFERGPAGHDGHPTAAEQEFVTHSRDQQVKPIGEAEAQLSRKPD